MTALAGLTWPQAEKLAARILLIPLGSTEQHGPHLPLSTDTDIAVALASRIADVRPDIVVAPAIAYGASGEHADFAGTLSIGQQALELLLVELGRSAALSFGRLLVLNAHGGNAQPVSRAVRLLQAEGRDVRAWSPRLPGDAHAGRTETSLQLALDASRVRTELAAAGAVGPLPELLPALQSSGVRAVSPNGVLGDPAGATATLGADLLAAAVTELAGYLYGWAAR